MNTKNKKSRIVVHASARLHIRELGGIVLLYIGTPPRHMYAQVISPVRSKVAC